MISEIENLINKVHNVPYDADSSKLLSEAISILEKYLSKNHFLRMTNYQIEITLIRNMISSLSSYKSDEDRLLQKKIQRQITNLSRTILNENKKIFIVHGRDIIMRDKVSAMLGKLKLDYVILESEHNTGATIIEKFIRNAKDCRYAVVLFSGDDIGGLNKHGAEQKVRTRQNVVLELGYFLSNVGRKNITILHDVKNHIEKPSDFDGIVYEPFDEYGAWKNKLIKEMRLAKIYVDQNLADRV